MTQALLIKFKVNQATISDIQKRINDAIQLEPSLGLLLERRADFHCTLLFATDYQLSEETMQALLHETRAVQPCSFHVHSLEQFDQGALVLTLEDDQPQQTLTNLHQRLMMLSNAKESYDQYRPHVTIGYTTSKQPLTSSCLTALKSSFLHDQCRFNFSDILIKFYSIKAK